MNFESYQNPKPPTAMTRPNQDEQHLALLAVFHYVLGAILGIASFIPSLHLIVGILMVNEAFDSPDPPPEFLGWLLIFGSLIFILGGLTCSLFVAFNGRRIAKRKALWFCVAVAGIECVFMPLGTLLGVFTIIVLMRPSVKQLFGIQLHPKKPQ